MKSLNITHELFEYIEKIYSPADQLMSDLLAETQQLEIPMIQVSSDQAKFLYLLAKIINAKNALEIGTLTGYSGIHIARGLPEDGMLTTVDINPKHSELAAKYFRKAGLGSKAEIVTSPALEHMRSLVKQGKKFDFIFIDADKTGYNGYYEEALRLSHSGTVIAFDNMLKGGSVTDLTLHDPDLDAVREMNVKLAKDERVECLLVTIGDGLGLCRVK
jgi:predicted O-methyltransferase YrrM